MFRGISDNPNPALKRLTISFLALEGKDLLVPCIRRQRFTMILKWGGTGGRETGRKGGGRCTGGGRGGGGKRDSQGGGKREKKEKITQHSAIFRNRKNVKRREPTNTGREPGLKGTGGGRFKPPCPPPPTLKAPKRISYHLELGNLNFHVPIMCKPM